MNHVKRMLTIASIVLLLLLNLMPVAAAESNIIDVYITETAPTLDGAPNEFVWFVDHSLSDIDTEGAPCADAGFMWNETGLYAAVQHDGAKTITLTLGEKTAVYDVASATFTANDLNAQAAVSGNSAEFLLPFSVSNFDQQVEFDLSVSDSAGTASLTKDTVLCMRSIVLYAADGSVDLDNAGYVAGARYGSYAKVTITQDDGCYHVYAPAEKTITNGIRRNISYPGGDVDVEFTVKINELPVIPSSYAWRGFIFELRDSTYVYRAALNKDASGTIYFNYLAEAGSQRKETTLKEGDIAAIRIEYRTGKMDVYINGELLAEIPFVASSIGSSSSNPRNILEISAAHYNWTSGATDVELYGYCITRRVYETEADMFAAALDNLSFDTIKGQNTSPANITSDLVLPDAALFPYLEGVSAELTWTSSRPDVISNTGVVTRPATGADAVILTATTPDGQYREFVLIVNGLESDNTVRLVATHDTNPAAGAGVESEELMFTLDTGNNSVILDLGAVAAVNVVQLEDLDKFSRINRESLTLWVSDDNVTYTEIEDYKLFQNGMCWYLYDFSAQGRYVKVHYTHFDGTNADFTAPLPTMIEAWYDDAIAPFANGGVTWYSSVDRDGDNIVNGDLSTVYTPNTQPYMQMWDFDQDGDYEAPLLFWGGNNVLDGTSYRRNPYNVAISYDGLETWKNIQTLFFETFMEDYTLTARHYVTNPSIAQSGNDMTTTFERLRHGDYIQIITDNFSDWFYRTKGGYDTFENGTLRADGWVIMTGAAETSPDQATDGSYAMKLNQSVNITRSVPCLQDGRVVLNVYNTGADFTLELQAAYSNQYGEATPVAISVANGGEPKAMPVAMNLGDYVCYLTFDAEGTVYVDEVLIESYKDAIPFVRVAKEDAIAELEAYRNALNGEDYRQVQIAELDAAVADGKAAIEAAQTSKEVAPALEAGKAALDAVKTDEEMSIMETLDTESGREARETGRKVSGKPGKRKRRGRHRPRRENQKGITCGTAVGANQGRAKGNEQQS